MAAPPSELFRTALVGLSASPTGYGWLTFHLQAIRCFSSQLYIVAVQGSSRVNAQKAILKHNLATPVQPYGSTSDLFADKAASIDMLVVGVIAPLHRDVIAPHLQSDVRRLKALFVEWPIDITLPLTRDIASTARAQNIRTAVGLQGRFTALIRHIASLIKSGLIGEILSTNTVGTVPTGDGRSETQGTRYTLDPSSGATMLDIHFAHFVDCLTFSLQADITSVSGLVAAQHSTTDIVDSTTGEILERAVAKPSADQIIVHGTMKRRGSEQNIVWSLHMRGGTSIGGGMRWLIYGTNGEIEITNKIAILPHINLPVPWTVRVKLDGENEAREEQLSEEEPGQPAVRRLWEAFLTEQPGSWPDFEHAVKIHRVVDAVKRSAADKKTVTL